MAEMLTRIIALRRFLEKDSTNPPQTTELMGFWKSLNEAERAEFSASAAKQLGVELVNG